MGFRASDVTYKLDTKSNMAVLASDWLTYFPLLLNDGCRDLL